MYEAYNVDERTIKGVLIPVDYLYVKYICSSLYFFIIIHINNIHWYKFKNLSFEMNDGAYFNKIQL